MPETERKSETPQAKRAEPLYSSPDAPTIRLALAWLGASAVISQALLAREILAVAGGVELVLGLILFSWLFWAGIGSLLARWLPTKCGYVYIVMGAFLQGAACFTSVILVRVLAGALLKLDGTLPDLAISSLAILLATAPAALIAGAVLAHAVADPCPDGGRALLWDTMGGAVGGAVYSLLIVGHLSNLQSGCAMLFLGSILLPAACFRLSNAATERIVTGDAESSVSDYLTGFGAISLFGLVLLSWLSIVVILWLDPYPPPVVRMFPSNAKITFYETRQQQIVLVSRPGQLSVFADGEPVLDYPDVLAGASSAHFAACTVPECKRVLLAGGLGHSVITPLLAHRPERIDVIEFDAQLYEILQPFLNTADSAALRKPAVHVLSGDPHRHLLATPEKYDLVWLNVPPPSSLMANRYYTQSFYRNVAAALSPRGALFFSTVGAPNYSGPELSAYLGTVRATLASVFPHIVELPGASETFICAKASGVLPSGPSDMSQRLLARGLGDAFQPEIFSILWEEEQVRQRERAIAPLAQTLPVNDDLNPRAMRAYLRVWNRFQEHDITGLGAPHQANPAWVWGFAGVVAAIVIFTARQRAQLWIAAISGATGMMAELLLLCLFQSACGYVYEQMALLVGMYVLGFGIGAFVFNAETRRAQTGQRTDLAKPSKLVAQSLLALLLCTGLALAMTIFWPQAQRTAMFAVPVLLTLTAACMGVLLPALIAVAQSSWIASGKARNPGGLRHTAGWILGIDYLAGAMAALLGSVLVIPWIGVAQSAALVCAMVLVALLVWHRAT
ncbi:MAG TPA: hypothetical protein VGP72_28400 [Planctomycetota bacterium]|jgi:predicted membrane-bound spermidine synthase